MELPLAGTSTILSFFPDDTIETVRQTVALALNTHPDRLFVQVQLEFPKEYYSTNPKRWMDLFFRLSHGKNIIKKEILEAYLSHVRTGTGVSARDVTREEWETFDPYVIPIFDPANSFKEWRILGVPEDKSMILPVPPKDILIPEAYRPVPTRQSLFETMHPEEAHELMAVELDDKTSDAVKQVYFPFFQSTTPNNIETLRAPMKASRDQLKNLLDLKAPKPTHVSILRSKWYVPLVSTKFSAPRTRFEQIFYGLTVSPETPVISYFTGKTETTRHKFYVDDPKSKKPHIDVPMWKSWMSNTQPQRRLPTLLLYRGKDRNSFDRIAITSRDITVSVWRGKNSKETLDDLKESTLKWIQSMDAVMPFLVETDIDLSRWELNDLSIIASYAKEISEFDMLRFPCLRDIFSFQDDTFRLLRADREFDVPSQVLKAYSLLQNGEGDLQGALGVSDEEALVLRTRVQELEADEHFNFEKALSGYPTVSFSAKEVIVKFVSNLDRVIEYANILRHVLTSGKAEVNSVCPRQMETVEAKSGTAPTTLAVEEEFVLDDFLMGELADLEPTQQAVEEAPKETTLKVRKTGAKGTYKYFASRANAFDADMFDGEYPKKCEKMMQVVVLSDADKERIQDPYKYSDAPETQKLELEKGTAVCPQYWCMKDEIPLSNDQLVVKEDGLHCPVCDGKVRITDKEDPREFTIIKRNQEATYPGWKEPSAKTSSKKRVPCCYKRPETKPVVLGQEKSAIQLDDYYVLSSGVIPAFRIAYIPHDLATRLNIKTNYPKNVPGNRIEASAIDMFRVGLGQPRDTLPELLNDKRHIPTPEHARDKVIQCSFFRTWKDLGDGETDIDRIIAGIDRAYREKSLTSLQEIEYVTRILDCRVMRINAETQTMMCGFWSENTSASSRTIALVDADVLGLVRRRKGKSGSKFDYVIDVNKFPDEAKKTLQSLHVKACSTDAPTFESAVSELMAKNVSQYQVILDPFKRVQAVFVPQEVVLPIHPVSMDIPMGVSTRSGYADIKDEELPTSESQLAFMKGAKHTGFKWVEDVYSADGYKTEFLLESGFRAPFRPEQGEGEVKEVISTIRPPHTEEELVSAPPNKEDMRIAQEISYSSEVFEFLMFSLSKDIQTDEYESLRASIANPSETLYKDLSKWLNEEAYWDSVNEPVQFVNKVRTPCGQMEKDTCKKSTLCGWHQNTCKIKVKPIVDRNKVLVRLAKTLKENSKQRALVLDGRLSPFFSTILYLEMPHELITTSV
jgi:hypothetical protein